jgi:predicted nucleotidyltransferase
MEYINLFKRLYEQKVRYLICGGLAVNIYGIPRMTADIDLLVAFDNDNIKQFEQVIEELEFASVVPIQLNSLLDESERANMIEEKNLIAYSYYSKRANFMNLDVLIDVPISFEGMWEVREEREIEDFKINIVSLNDLIQLKKYANRTQDKQDVLMLNKLQNIATTD